MVTQSRIPESLIPERMSGAFTRVRRSTRFAKDAAIIYAGYKRTARRTRDLDQVATDAIYDVQHESAAKRLYHLAVDLKGLNIKTGQFIGARPDLVPQPFIKWLGRLHDQVPPRPLSVVRQTIREELGEPVESLFTEFDPDPIGAASLAQVHRATLPDGRDVAVKVQYPEVEKLVTIDLANTTRIVNFLARNEPNFDYRTILAEMSNEVPHELNFVREAEMIRRVAANLANLDQVVLPEVIDGYVTRRVLVTSFIDGPKILDREGLRRIKADPEELAWSLAAAYGHQILSNGLFQADPHPGNILVRNDGKLALIDFGLTKEFPDGVRHAVARLVVAFAAKDPMGILAAFQELGIETKHDEPGSLLTLVRLLLDERPMIGSDVLQASEQALTYNPINAIPEDIVLLGRVISLLRGVATSLEVSFTPMEMLLPYAEAMLEGRPPPVTVGPIQASPAAPVASEEPRPEQVNESSQETGEVAG